MRQQAPCLAPVLRFGACFHLLNNVLTVQALQQVTERSWSAQAHEPTELMQLSVQLEASAGGALSSAPSNSTPPDALMTQAATELEHVILTPLHLLDTNKGHLLCSILVSCFSCFFLLAVRDLRQFVQLQARVHERQAKRPATYGSDGSSSMKNEDKPEVASRSIRWSVPSLMALTSYRFYTGFLSATWLPYLLAMEGQDLWRENQSLFMGVAKLIYGATILLNPIFGLLGDQAVTLSHGTGRRLFVCSGICVASVGIVLCLIAGPLRMFYTFILGILIWRLGEALNDVTTEALVPEMVPEDQYQLGSAVKSSSFLLGGLFGYVLLIALAGVHYSWLYYAYLAGMFTCSIPSLLLLQDDRPSGRSRRTGQSFSSSLSQAYLTPTRYQGGFWMACVAVFIFSLGTAPMFFLLLILRDLVGISDALKLQQQFSASSIVFFISAAVFAAGTTIQKETVPKNAPDAPKLVAEARIRKVWFLCVSMTVFGLVILTIPALALLSTVRSRSTAFYMLASVFGAAFGSAFSRFQDVTWAELPSHADLANAMGFNVMSRLLGVGLGNFIAGLILDCFYTGQEVPVALHHRHRGPLKLIASPSVHHSFLTLKSSPVLPQVYSVTGYVCLCTYCGVLTLAAVVVSWRALTIKQADETRTAA